MNHPLPLRNILDLTFRVNPSFELIAENGLLAFQPGNLKAPSDNPEPLSLLISRDFPGLGVLAVAPEGAAFLDSLRQPGRLPIQGLNPVEVASMVWDGILEVEWDGQYVTGPAAAGCLFTQLPQEPEPIGRVSTFSFAALKLAQEIPGEDPKALSAWLYSYNALPMSPHWARRFVSAEEIELALGLSPGGAVQALLNDHYLFQDIPGWRAWQHLDAGLDIQASEPTFKLYISPQPGIMAEVFPVIARCFAEAGVLAFKLGMSAFGLLRPDKLIAYFSSYNALEALVDSLARALSGCPAQGVPFTAALDADGLLSWGMDPPRSEQIPGWRGDESWRVWVTDRLARGILRGKTLEYAGIAPWHYACLRLQLEGVQIQTWLPDIDMWTDDQEGNERI